MIAPGVPPIVLVVLLLGSALVYDIRTRRIPNWLVLAELIGGVGCSLFSLQVAAVNPSFSSMMISGFGGLGQSLLGALAVLVIMLPLLVAIGSRSLPRVLDNLRLMGLAATGGRTPIRQYIHQHRLDCLLVRSDWIATDSMVLLDSYHLE